jgi:hypothetical protein
MLKECAFTKGQAPVKRTEVWKALAAFLFILFLTLATAGFDSTITSPFHEIGHAMAARMLGLQIIKMEWSRILIGTANDWRDNVMSAAGGLFGALILSALYVVIAHSSKLAVDHTTRRRLKRSLISLTLALKIIIFGDIIVQLNAAILEGAFKSLYDTIVSNPLMVFIITAVFTGISFRVHVNRLPHSDIALLSSELK